MIIGKRASAVIVRCCICMLIAASIPTSSSHAESGQPFSWEDSTQTDELRNILQQSLSIQELDQEIDRINERANAAAEQQITLQEQLQIEQGRLSAQQDHAGRVLRSYYMGERDLLLQAVFLSSSFSDMFRLMDYYFFLMEHDQQTLLAYRDRVRNIQQLREEQQQLVTDLNAVKENLLAQRNRLLEMESELSSSVAASSDPEAMQLLIQEFTSYWQSVGMFEVKHYFRAIAQAMQQLPNFVKENGNLVSNGLQYTLTIQDHELNQFLREQDDMFNDFSFIFNDGMISAVGQREGIQVVIEGRYTLEYEPEHALRFHIDTLRFNGLTLSEETRDEMTKQFDLSFYPQQLVKFIEAKEVKLEDHLLTVKLQIKL